jgi:hypothetical protein
MAKTGKTEVVLNLKVSDGELSLIFDKAKKGFARLSADQKESLKLQEKQDAAAKKYTISKTSEGKAIQRTNAETREENRLSTLSQTNKVKVTKAVEKLTFANSAQNQKVQEHNILSREQNRIINLEINQSIQLKKSKERLTLAQSQVGQETLKNNKLAIEAERIATLNLSRDVQLAKAQENIAFWTSKKGKELAKANIQAKEAANQASLLAVKEMEAADAAKELSNATKGAAKGFDQMKTTAGLSGAIVTEVGRTISDAPYGLRGMGNNLSQLASLFGMFSVNVKKSGRTMTQGFKQLGASLMGPIGMITGLQILIALLQSGAFEKLFSIFEKGTDALFKYNKELFKLTESIRANQAVSLSHVEILKDVNTSEKERSKIIKELIRLTPTLKEEDFKYKENLGEVILQIEAYTLAQANRIEADKLVQENSALLAKKARIESIKLIESETEKAEKIKELLVQSGIEITNSTTELAASAMQGQDIYKSVITPKTIEQLTKDFRKLAEVTEKEAAPILKQITDLTQGFLVKSDDDGGGTTLDRKIKEFTKKSFDLLSEVLRFEQDLLNTTYRTQQQIIKDEQKLQEDSIALKRDEFKAREELRLKNYIAQQEANKKLKGADVSAIDAAIERAKVKTATMKTEADTEATNAIAAIDKVTEARISNQQKLDDFERLKAGMSIVESGASTDLAMMPEGMAKVDAESALDQLRYDNKVVAAERELALLTTTDERKREIGTQMALWQDEKRTTDLKNDINVINEKTRIQQEYVGFLSGLTSVLGAISNKNKEWQKVTLLSQKAAAIAGVVIEASKSIGIQTASHKTFVGLTNAKYAGVPGGLALASGFNLKNGVQTGKNIAKTKLGAGLSIAAITAGTISGLSSISNSGGGGASGGGGGAAAQSVQPPDFNIIGSTGTNQLADAIGSTTQQPIKAYVVSGEVTSAQELDRNIEESASI